MSPPARDQIKDKQTLTRCLRCNWRGRFSLTAAEKDRGEGQE